MNTKTPNTLLFLLTFAECTSTTPQRKAEDMVAETAAGHGAADLPATDEHTGWCCNCESYVGSAWSARLRAQTRAPDGFAWCLLDTDGGHVGVRRGVRGREAPTARRLTRPTEPNRVVEESLKRAAEAHAPTWPKVVSRSTLVDDLMVGPWLMAGLHSLTMQRDETTEEDFLDFLDCTGKKRRFRLQSYAAGTFLDATELLDGDAVGMRFVMRADADGVLPWGLMREKIRARMAERDVAVDPDTGRLEILRGLVRAHIDSVPELHEEDEQGPVLIVDDRRITWRELGEMLVGLEGWNLRIEILDLDGV